ncbi:hypothetical protein Q3V23_29720 [Streptomyces sp. VNUA116]|uniref:hypothetical protein n=1 Tax=Streptomyces sp. VNUA116 TaxID=3062449 RepID=UPI00267645EE|nr:hypothetical protein [Streptomyces sp. VNUA116]WKU47898.1 hypothetical protein Q3V23_29720 [Streptomyces sp. VNUA116]
MSGARNERRWAELAREQEFIQLPELRRQAEGWRTGLTGLTALITVLVVLKGRDNLADLPPSARLAATALLGCAFLVLVTGSLLAVRASHGRPGEEIVLGGQALRRWTQREVVRVGRALWAAAVCCVLGVVLVAAAVATAWSTAGARAADLVEVRTPSGTVCGELREVGAQGVSVWVTAGGVRELRVLPAGEGTTITPAKACPAGS